MQRFPRVAALNKYKAVLAEYKELSKGIDGDQWTLGATKDVTMEKFWTWAKVDYLDALGDVYLGKDRCLDFKKYIWFELGKSMWKKYQSVFQDHVKYIHNDIVKPFIVGILHYSERVYDIHDLEKNLPPLSMKGVWFEGSSWFVRDK